MKGISFQIWHILVSVLIFGGVEACHMVQCTATPMYVYSKRHSSLECQGGPIHLNSLKQITGQLTHTILDLPLCYIICRLQVFSKLDTVIGSRCVSRVSGMRVSTHQPESRHPNIQTVRFNNQYSEPQHKISSLKMCVLSFVHASSKKNRSATKKQHQLQISSRPLRLPDMQGF